MLESKFTKFLSFLKQQIDFSSNFASLFSVMRHNSSTNHSKVQKFHFDGLFSPKVYEVWSKKIQRSYLSWHWTVRQNLNKLWPCRPWRIGGTFSGGLKARKLCVMTLTGDAKFKGKLTRGLKNDWKNLVSFHASSRKSENLYVDVLLCYAVNSI